MKRALNTQLFEEANHGVEKRVVLIACYHVRGTGDIGEPSVGQLRHEGLRSLARNQFAQPAADEVYREAQVDQLRLKLIRILQGSPSMHASNEVRIPMPPEASVSVLTKVLGQAGQVRAPSAMWQVGRNNVCGLL